MDRHYCCCCKNRIQDQICERTYRRSGLKIVHGRKVTIGQIIQSLNISIELSKKEEVHRKIKDFPFKILKMLGHTYISQSHYAKHDET